VSASVFSSLRSIQTTSSWYLGGTPDDVRMEIDITKFHGCVSELVVNKVPYRLAGNYVHFK